MADLYAAEAAGGGSDSLLVVLASIVTAMVGGLVVVGKALIDGKTSRSVAELQHKPSAPDLHSGVSSAGSVDLVKLAGDVRVLMTWRAETREADDLHDRTLHKAVGELEDLQDIVARLTRWHDRHSPGWREP